MLWLYSTLDIIQRSIIELEGYPEKIAQDMVLRIWKTESKKL